MPDQCGYCYRNAVATIYLRRSLLRLLLRRPALARRVCTDHIHGSDRPGGWYA